MTQNKKTYKILVISNPNQEVFYLKQYLDDSLLKASVSLTHSTTEAIKLLAKQEFHIIFIDLGKASKFAEDRLEQILNFTTAIPTVILSNEMDMPFSIRCLEKGASDYLMKDSLDAFTVYKAIRHNIDRKSYIHTIEESKLRYSRLFHLSPQPMLVYDIETLSFLDVNEAALIKYGYPINEFLTKTLIDIRSLEEVPEFLKTVYETKQNLSKSYEGIFKHLTKDGEVLDVEIHSNLIKFDHKPARLILANDITKQLQHIKAIEKQNQQLREIAWTQSHVVRAPLVRMMALINMLNENHEEKSDFYLKEILNSAYEFDNIIRQISEKTAQIELED